MHVIGDLFHGIGVLIGELVELAAVAALFFVFFYGLHYMLYHH
jgi:hypothetical protein